MRRQFRVRELIELCGGVRRKAIEKYLALLVRAGYVRVAERGRGCKGQVYALVRNTGPFAPRAGRLGITLDPNEAIATERAHHAELLKEIRRVEQRLGRLGAYIEKFQPSAQRGEENGKK